MKNTVVLIMSGYNTRALISFCRFCRENDIRFYIVALNNEDLINFTDYDANIIETRKSIELNFKDFLRYKEEICKVEEFDELFILPSSEYLNRFLLDNLFEFEQNGFIIPLTEIKLYEKVSDKYSFCELCEQNGINIPKEYKVINENKIPFVAKPKQYFIDGKIINEKPHLIMNLEDYKSFANNKKTNDFYYQEFVGGASYYLLYYFSTDKTYSVYSQENFIQQDKGLSIIGAKSSRFHDHIIASKFAKLFIEIGFTGLVMIEVKKYNDIIYMIEANPRLWGPSQLIIDANMNLFHRFAQDFGLIDKKSNYTSTYIENVTYFWSGGLFQDLDTKNQPVFHQYNETTFFNEYHHWISNDIYIKNDTIGIYYSELNKQIK